MKELKRKHPVNHNSSDMIDVNEMIDGIDAGDDLIINFSELNL